MRARIVSIWVLALAATFWAKPNVSSGQTITPLPTSDTALLGRFAQGPVDWPVRVTAAEFAAIFSSGNPSIWPAEIQAREFFANGGTSLFIVRIADAIPLVDALLGQSANFTGLQALATLSDLRLLIAPELSLLSATDFPNALAGFRAFVEPRRIFLIVDPPATVTDVNSMIAWVQASVPADAAFCAVYYPSLLVQIDGAPLTVTPCGAMAAIFGKADLATGIWRSPSGTGFPISALGVSVAMNTAQSTSLSDAHINPIRQFATIIPFGARTLDRTDFENQYVPVVRTRGWVASSIERGLAFAALADDAAPLWGQVTNSVSTFLFGLWIQGALFGNTANHAYFVLCDATTNSAADIAAHRVNVLYGAAYLASDEFYLDELGAPTFDSARTPGIPALQAHVFAGNLQLAFPTEAGFDYTIESSSDLASAPWAGDVTIPGDGAWHSAEAPVVPGNLFRRLRIVPTSMGARETGGTKARLR